RDSVPQLLTIPHAEQDLTPVQDNRPVGRSHAPYQPVPLEGNGWAFAVTVLNTANIFLLVRDRVPPRGGQSAAGPRDAPSGGTRAAVRATSVTVGGRHFAADRFARA